MKTLYHFTGSTLRDGSPIPPIGEWLKHDGPVVMCESGLHASPTPFTALQYAPGSLLHRVNLRGDLIVQANDKSVGRERRILNSVDSTDLLRQFARSIALKVIHLWDDAPTIVREYLETGNESKRDAAGDAARDAAGWVAGDAARAATWTAAWAAARATAWAAARAAAGAAAWAAARAAAWDEYALLFNDMVEKAFQERKQAGHDNNR